MPNNVCVMHVFLCTLPHRIGTKLDKNRKKIYFPFRGGKHCRKIFGHEKTFATQDCRKKTGKKENMFFPPGGENIVGNWMKATSTKHNRSAKNHSHATVCYSMLQYAALAFES